MSGHGSTSWTKKDIPKLDGKTAIVTGGNGGLGYEVSLGLAEAGASVIMAARNEIKAQQAIDKIKALHPEAKVSFAKVDLSSLASVKEFAETINAKNEPIDILVNNAGIAMTPRRITTVDGFELQFATNHLSHFALTALLLPSLRKSSAPRVVTVSGLTAHRARINFDDLQFEKTSVGIATLGQSKLANLLFAFELQRKSEAGGWGVNSYAAHPGVSKTDGIENGPGKNSLIGIVMTLGRPFFPEAAAGALSILYAATSPDAKPGGYYGPQGLLQLRGAVGPSRAPPQAEDLEVAKRLWDVSNQLTGVTWPEP
jgi:NAD(P)-dependent dehydrogenase (short-subunit alcohol dehydrogenase family)